MIGHSMSADLATLMAAGDTGRRIRCLINVEGDLTPHDIFFSRIAYFNGSVVLFECHPERSRRVTCA